MVTFTLWCLSWSIPLDSPPLEMKGLGWMMSNPHRPSTGHGWGTHHRPQTMLWSHGLHHDLPNSSVGSDRSSRRGRDAEVHALWAVPCILSSTCHHPRGLKDDTYRRRRTHRTGGGAATPESWIRHHADRSASRDRPSNDPLAGSGIQTSFMSCHRICLRALKGCPSVMVSDFVEVGSIAASLNILVTGSSNFNEDGSRHPRRVDPSSWSWACRRWSDRRAEGPGCTRIRTKPPRIRLGFRSPSRPR